jgi:hypothetical protein
MSSFAHQTLALDDEMMDEVIEYVRAHEYGPIDICRLHGVHGKVEADATQSIRGAAITERMKAACATMIAKVNAKLKIQPLTMTTDWYKLTYVKKDMFPWFVVESSSKTIIHEIDNLAMLIQQYDQVDALPKQYSGYISSFFLGYLLKRYEVQVRELRPASEIPMYTDKTVLSYYGQCCGALAQAYKDAHPNVGLKLGTFDIAKVVIGAKIALGYSEHMQAVERTCEEYLDMEMRMRFALATVQAPEIVEHAMTKLRAVETASEKEIETAYAKLCGTLQCMSRKHIEVLECMNTRVGARF